MFIAAAVFFSLLAFTLIGSGQGKLAKEPRIVQGMAKAGVALDKLWLLALAEIAGAIGLVIGLFWWPVGAAAASCLVLYFIGALGAHFRAHDRHIVPAAIMLLSSIAALLLRLSTS